MKQVIFLLFPGIEILDFAGPLQTFAEAANRGCDITLSHCSWQTEIHASQNLFINRLDHFSKVNLREEDILVIPGMDHQYYTGSSLSQIPEAVFDWLRHAYEKKVQLCSICTGAFVLAHAGLLDEKRCTTHWMRARELARTYPRIRVETRRLFVYDQGIYTSAGVASGIDLALALVEKNWGPLMASKIARDLVVYMRRDGAHPQDSIYLSFRDHIDPVIHEVQDFLLSLSKDRPGIEDLACRFGLSPRHLTRLFKKATGITIKQYTTLVTLEHAGQLLKDPNNTMESIAFQCGFHDARHLRRLWKKHFNTTPCQARTP